MSTIHYIENEFLRVGVKEHGAELSSVVSKKTGYEYIWQGDTNVWYGQSPILFPIVGRLIEDKYTLNGTEYTMPKHGFARKSDFTLLSKDSDSMTFILSENSATKAVYPYDFDLIVSFTVEENNLRVSHDVVNKNDDVMYFSLGAHPGFNCQMGDILRFEKKETLQTEKIDLVYSLRLPEKLPVLNDETDIVITEDIFNEDALILSGIQSDKITLCSPAHDRTVAFDLGHAPYLGIWAKPGAPYVCIEPWCGVNDSTEKVADFSQKEGIQSVAADDVFNFTWKASFSE
ncbi:MAG: aldose 1-epimerase family protein [Clostridia bacterium]|nr:aldose 1-epimerase family protein [Clostridia bacterium]